MSTPTPSTPSSTRRRLGAVALGLLATTTSLVALAPGSASAETTIGQTARCDAGAAFVDVAITNTEAPLTVDVRVDGEVVRFGVEAATGETVTDVPYPMAGGETLQLVAAGTDDELASAPLVARPECGNPAITFATTSRCVGPDLKLVITVTSEDPGPLVVDVVFGGGPVAEGLALPSNSSAEVVIDYPVDLNPENIELAIVDVRNADTDELLVSGPIDVRGQRCDLVDDGAAEATPAAPIAAAPAYTG